MLGGYLVTLAAHNRSSHLVYECHPQHIFGRQGEYMAGAISRTIMMNVILGAMSPMVDNWSHLGGAIGGAVCAYLFGPRLTVGDTPTGLRTIVDKPILRLPKLLEEMPDQMADRVRIMKRRMQVESFKSALPEKPWRKRKIDYRQRQNVEPKSIRPSF